MKHVGIVACALLFISAAAFAQASGPAPLSSAALAMILGQPAGSDCGAPQESGVALVAQRPAIALGEKALCTATANCESGTVSCQGNNSTTSCSAIDRNCTAGQRGSVTCDGVTTYCPTTCPTCNNCCRCAQTGDCFACCRCDGGTLFQCSEACG